MTDVIYKLTAKGLRNTKMTEDHRLIIRGDGSALLFLRSGLIEQVDLAYRRPDSHVEVTSESMQDYTFSISHQEYAQAQRYTIKLPDNTVVL